MASREELDRKAKEALKSLPQTLTVKDRMAIEHQEMPSQDPDVRKHNMDEVALGYSEDIAVLEAQRCLNCKNKPCMSGCPVSIDIPRFIERIQNRDFKGALSVIQEESILPSICGRVCPQEAQCQKYCTVGKALKDVDKAVAIGRLERFVADYNASDESVPDVKAPTGKRVAVVGSGPASIACAADVRREGHDVVMFEALHKTGGVLSYGIPEFRLPKHLVDKEIKKLEKMGVDIEKNVLIGRTRTIEELKSEDGFDAIFIGTGAGLPKFMGIPGENLVGVLSANEYLTRSNLMKAYDKANSHTPEYEGRRVAVLGGGNVAMDAARTALRLGAETVDIIYRRTRSEMPARKEEIEHAVEEGCSIRMLSQPVEILGDDKGRVRALVIRKCELGEMDASGRRSPVEIEGSDEEIAYDEVIVAIGNASNPLIKLTTPEIEVNRRGNFIVDEETNQTNMEGVYAGGDIVLGAATVILAMGQGRKAAKAINEYLKGK
ncbi:MAG TPA: NADPH-dependent glutamate synthase [Candidatus Ornithospirochaeta stercorigallinarum]|nr:NADPH-dependent glutamate synthase [Candidatus Ornithospirochaeta stercorigallinarum]